MGVRSFDHVEITGLTASGTTDNAGAWNTSVDLGSYATIPSGATGAIFSINVPTNQRWFGLRKPGAANPETLVDVQQQQGRVAFCPLGAGNTIDIYIENTTDVKVYLVAVVDWDIRSADETRETFAATNAWTNYTLASAPAGTIGCVVNSQNSLTTGWRPFGNTSVFPTQSIGRMVVPVDGSFRFSARSASADTLEVVAYITSGVTWPTVDSVSESFTADSTWRTSAMTAAGRQLVQIRRPSGTDSAGGQFRKSGSSYNPNSTVSTFIEWPFVPVGSDGKFQYWLETGATQNTFYLTAYFDDFASGVRRIRPATMITAQPATVAGTGAVA